MLPGISAVAFDLDGTLYPNYRLHIRLLPFLCRQWPLVAALGRARVIIRREQEQSGDTDSILPGDFYGRQARLCAALLRRRPGLIQEKTDRLIYRGWEPLFLKIKPFPFVREMLDELKAAGLKLGLLSDFPPELKLKNMGLDHYWDAVLCSESFGALKPAVRPFAELAQALGCLPEQVLYVGNSRPYDAAGAARAGMKSALRVPGVVRRPARSGKSTAHFIFHDYRQLRDFVLQ